MPAGAGLVSLSPLQAAWCTQNTFGQATARPAVASATCTSCPLNTFTADVLSNSTLAGSGYTNASACLLRPGWGLDAPNGTAAAECSVGSFSAGANSTPCTSCPRGYTTSTSGSTSQDACFIQPGW